MMVFVVFLILGITVIVFSLLVARKIREYNREYELEQRQWREQEELYWAEKEQRDQMEAIDARTITSEQEYEDTLRALEIMEELEREDEQQRENNHNQNRRSL